MRLRDAELRLIDALDSRADLSFAEVARRLRMREFTAQRAFQRLVELGLIRGRSLYVDAARAGLQEYGVYFTIASGQSAPREKMLAALRTSRHVRWLAEVGGDFEHAASFLVRDVFEIRAELDRIEATGGGGFARKEVAVRATVVRFPRSLSGKRSPLARVIEAGTPGERITIDDTDDRVLRALSDGSLASDAELARASGIPQATFSRRARMLEARGLVVARTYRIDLAATGMSSYRLLVGMRSTGKQLRSEMRRFCEGTVPLRVMVECLGSWDYELELEVRDGRELKHFTGALRRRFPETLQSVAVVPIFEHLKYRGWP